jgi:anti-anti-sigma factor
LTSQPMLPGRWLVSKISRDGVRAPGSGPGLLGWSQRRVDGAEVICLAGELDLAASAELRSRLMSIAESDTAAVTVLDLSDVRFIDAKCVGVIVAAWETVQRRGGQFEVAGLHGLPAFVLEVLGLEPILAPPNGHQRWREGFE